MHAKASMRLSRKLALIILSLALSACVGEGEGEQRIFGRAATPLPPVPSGFCDAINFEILCPPVEINNFNGGATTIIDNPDVSGLNTSDKVAQMQKFPDEVFGGTLLELSTAIDFSAGEVYTVKVWSPRSVEVLFKIEQTGNPNGGVTAVLDHSGSGTWEELCFDFTGLTATVPPPVVGLTIIFDNGTQGAADTNPGNWTFYYDDIEQVESCDGGGTGSGGGGGGATTLPVNFENAAASYDFGVDGGFEGGAASVIANPQANGINTSAQVGQMKKFAGAVFGGSTLAVAPTTVAAGSSFSMKVWSQRAVPVLFQLEPFSDPFITSEVTHLGSGWEELTFAFPSFSGEISGITLIFDDGTSGAAETDSANWTFYFDDIRLIPPAGGGGGGGGGTGVELAVNGDFETGDLTGWTTFNNGGSITVSSPGSTGDFAANLNVTVPGNPTLKQANVGAGQLTAGQQVTVSFDWKGMAGTGGVVDVRLFTETSGSGPSQEDILVEGAAFPADWTTFGPQTITIGPDASGGVTLQFTAICGGDAGCVSDLFVDNVSITTSTGGGGTGGGGTGGGGDTGGGGVGDELAVNGGFETGDLTGWTPDATTGGLVELVDTGASSGIYAVHLVAGATQSPLIKQLELAAGTVMPGDTVTVSFDMKGTLTGVGGVVFAELFSEGNPTSQQFLGGGPIFPTADWATYTYTVTTGPDVSRGITLQLIAVCGAEACGVDVFFDNVSIVIGSGGGTGGGGDTGGGGVGDELAVNGGFETGDLTGWTPDATTGGLVELVDTGASSGIYAVHLVAGATQSPLIKQLELAAGTVMPGDTVTVSFDMKGTLTGVGGVVFAELFSEGNPTSQQFLGGGPIFPTADWATYTYTVTTGPDVSRGITLQLIAVCGAEACGVDVFFDNVSIVIGSGGGTGGGGGGGGGGTPEELAVNGGFETGDLTDWGADSTTGGLIEVVDIGASSGTYAAHLVAGPTESPLIKQLQRGAGGLSPGDTVTVSFDMKGTLAGAGGVVFAELFSEGNPTSQQFLGGGPIFPTADWATYTYTVTTGPDVSRGITLQLLAVCGAEDCAVDVFFDNVSITAVLSDTGGGDSGGGVDTGGEGSCGGSGELASNCDFEAGDLTGWTAFDNGGLIEVVDNGASSGGFAAHMVAGPGKNPLIKQFELVAGQVMPGDTVNISFDMRGSLTGEGGVVFAEFFSEGDPTTAEILSGGPITPTATWATYTFAPIAGPDVSRGITFQLVAVCGAVDGCGVDVYFDNVSITIDGVSGTGGGGGGTGGGGTGGGGAGGDGSFSTLDFDEAGTTYTLTGFDGAEGSFVTNDPAGGTNMVLQIDRSATAAPGAGTTISTGPNLSIPALPLDVQNTQMTVRVYSPAAGIPVRLRIENASDPAISVQTEVPTTVGGMWETLTFNFLNEVPGTTPFDPAAVYDKLTIYFNFGTDGATAGAQTFYVDDIAILAGTGGGNVLATFDEATPPTVVVYGGATATIEPGPAGGDGSNALRILRDGGQNFAGAYVVVTSIPGDAGAQTVSAEVYSPAAGVPMAARLAVNNGSAGTGDVFANETVVAGWQTLTWTFSNLDPAEVYPRFALLPNVGTVDTATSYFFDRITLLDAGGGTGGGGTGGDDAVLATFDEATPPAVTAFGGAVQTIEAGPAGGDGNALQIVRNGGESFAGAWVAVTSIPNDAGAQTVSALVYSPSAGIPMVTKAEYGENQGTGDVQANETVVVGWQTLTWTYTNLAASNVYNRFVILPNLGTVDTATSYYFDNITIVSN